MKKTTWVTVAIIIAIVLLVFPIMAGLLGGWRYGGWGMMGPGMMGGWGFSPFGWAGMMFMWLIPLGFLALVVMGIAWLVQNVGRGTNSPNHACPACGRNVQSEWHNCPYCGTSLSK